MYITREDLNINGLIKLEGGDITPRDGSGDSLARYSYVEKVPPPINPIYTEKLHSKYHFADCETEQSIQYPSEFNFVQAIGIREEIPVK